MVGTQKWRDLSIGIRGNANKELPRHTEAEWDVIRTIMAEKMSERPLAGQSHTETYCNAYQAAEKELLTTKGAQRFGSTNVQQRQQQRLELQATGWPEKERRAVCLTSRQLKHSIAHRTKMEVQYGVASPQWAAATALLTTNPGGEEVSSLGNTAAGETSDSSAAQ